MRSIRALAIVLTAALSFSAAALAQSWQPEIGMDRPGNDYRNFSTAKNDWKSCKAACEGDGVCRAWTLYTPQDATTSHCWIKNLAGDQKPSALAVSGLREGAIAPLAISPAARTSSAAKREAGVTYAGEDIGGSLLRGGKGDWGQCAALCEKEGRCDSWTYEFERKDISVVCSLKSGVGAKTKTDKRYSSGLRQTPKPAMRAAAPPPPTEADLAAAKIRAQRVPEEVVELHRPRFNLRKLSAAEKAEARQIGQWTGSGLTWPEFQRLQQLAESGDKQAMELVYDALKNMPINRAFPFEVRDTKIESAPYMALASLWAAHIQDMHGVDTIKYPMPCSTAPRALYGDCGFRMENYSFTRQRADFSFVPVWGDDPFQRKRIDDIFKRMALNVEPTNVEVTWLQKYSETHDLSAEFKSAEAARSARLQSIAESNARQRAAAVEQSLASWNRLFGKQLDQKGASDLWWAARVLGGDYLQQYQSAYGMGGPPPMPETNWGAVASAWLNPGEVNVRVVDGNGNYRDTTMSSFQAAIIGARPQ